METKDKIAKFLNLFKKDSSRKIIIIIGICGILLIYLSTVFDSKEVEISTPASEISFSAAEYEKQIENNLARIVTAITGEESPQIMVTLDSASQFVYAENLKRISDGSEAYSDGVKDKFQINEDTQTEYIVLRDSSGNEYALKITEIQPKIKGVVVVSECANDTIVQEKLTNAVKTVLDIPSTRVCVVG